MGLNRKTRAKYIRTKKNIYNNFKLLGFYTIVFSTMGLAFSVTGKSINAYTKPMAAVAYAQKETSFIRNTDEILSKQSEKIAEVSNRFQNQKLKIEKTQQPQITEAAANSNIPEGLPLSGTVTSEFGERNDPINGEKNMHKGIDLAADTGTKVTATAGGIVKSARYSNSYGYIVEIDHGNGYLTKYAHNSSLTVKTGDTVVKGQTVAYSGSTGNSTGPHLHYEVCYEGVPVNPVSPLTAINK